MKIKGTHLQHVINFSYLFDLLTFSRLVLKRRYIYKIYIDGLIMLHILRILSMRSRLHKVFIRDAKNDVFRLIVFQLHRNRL